MPSTKSSQAFRSELTFKREDLLLSRTPVLQCRFRMMCSWTELLTLAIVKSP